MWQNVVWSGNDLWDNYSSDVKQPISINRYVSDHWYCVPVDIVMGIRLSISDNTCVSHSSPFVCLPHVYTCFTHELPRGQSLACGSGINVSEEQTHEKGHPGDARTVRDWCCHSNLQCEYTAGTQGNRTTNPEKLSIAGDVQADLDEVCSSEIWMRKDCVQPCNLHV